MLHFVKASSERRIILIVKIPSAALWGLDGFAVTVEAFFTKGLPETNIIGLPDAAVKESLSRITAAAGSLSLPLFGTRLLFHVPF